MRYLLPLGILLALGIAWLTLGGTQVDRERSDLSPVRGPLASGDQRSQHLALAAPGDSPRQEVDADILRVDPTNPSEQATPSSGTKDIVETGSCRLELRFSSRLTGEPVGGKVDLWRIDAPANHHWSRGDQLQASLVVRDGVARVEDLPEGWFRTHELFAAEASEPSEAFYVKGPSTRVQLIVDMPKVEQVALYLVLPSGVVLDGTEQPALQVRPGGWSALHSANAKPAWRTERLEKDGDSFNLIGLGGGGGMRSGSRWSDLDWKEGAISLGTMNGADREMVKHHSFKIRRGAGHHITVSIQPTGSGSYVAVLPDPEEVFGRLELPAEMDRTLVTSDLWITVTAVPVEREQGQSVASEWRASKATLRLWRDDVENRTQEWHPGLGPMPWTRVQAKVPVPGEE